MIYCRVETFRPERDRDRDRQRKEEKETEKEWQVDVIIFVILLLTVCYTPHKELTQTSKNYYQTECSNGCHFIFGIVLK